VRYSFGADLASWSTDLGDTATSLSGQAGNLALFVPGAVIEFYNAISGGAPYTDLVDNLGTATASITTDSNGEFPQFSGPDDVLYMYADGSGDGSGPRRLIQATNLGDVVIANRDSLTDLIDTVNSLQGLNASSLGIVEYDSVASSWPERPSDSRIYMWVGPSAPTVGGTGMQDGRDFWLNPTPVSA
jgi:hypothetical protein